MIDNNEIKIPRTVAAYSAMAVTLIVGTLIYVTIVVTNRPGPIKQVPSWDSHRYHFVTMVSYTDEKYTMICDRHTGNESLLAKVYKGSGDDRYITTMTQINMRYNPDCLNRDIAKYNRREWEEK